MPGNLVRVDVEGHIGVVTLEHPSAGNAISWEMAFQLRDACAQVERENTVWVVVLNGSGDAFCRGTEFASLRKKQAMAHLRVADDVAAISKPVIAAINGDALDQGLELALACDLRIADERAKLGLTQVVGGVIPWDGGTQRLPRLVGLSRAMELLLTARTVNAREAQDLGLVTEVVVAGQALSRAKELAVAIAGYAPVALRYLKEAVLKGRDLTLYQGMRLEADLGLLLHTTADRAEGIRSFLERRPPTYSGS